VADVYVRPVGVVIDRDFIKKVCTKDILSQPLTIQNIIS